MPIQRRSGFHRRLAQGSNRREIGGLERLGGLRRVAKNHRSIELTGAEVRQVIGYLSSRNQIVPLLHRSGCLIVCLILGAWSSTAVAQKWAADMFQVREHHFGTVAKNSDARYEFQFTNLYVEDVVIRGVRSSCGCITPSFQQQRLKTHETASIAVKFNTDRFEGQRNATVTVTFGEPFFAEVQLKAGGLIRGDVVVEPGRIDFGSLAAVSDARKSVTIDYRGGSNQWQILDVTSSFPHVRVGLQELQRQRGRVHYQLSARLLPEIEAGLHHVDLILVTNDPANREIPLTISANILQPLQVTPTFFELGDLTAGQEVTKHILVRSAAECRITSVEADCPALRAESTAGSKTLHRIPVTLTAGSAAGPMVGRIKIRTDQGAEETVEVHANILP